MLFLKVRLRLALPLLVTAPCLALAAPVRADAPLVGVRGWTSGSQTFVRVRPSALTPPVAKVPSNTPLYVWGRFNDWYRVETHDHIFGWVHKQYIRSPRLWKVKVVSHFKAKQASDAGSSQTMYGTPGELKSYYAQYGGEGARKGLALKGIYLAPQTAAPARLVKNPQTAPAPKPVFVARAPQLAPHLAPRVSLQIPPTRAITPPVVGAAVPVVGAAVPVVGAATPVNDAAPSRHAAQTLGRVPDAMAPGASSLADAVKAWTPAFGSAPVVVAAPHPAPASSGGGSSGKRVATAPRASVSAPIYAPRVPVPVPVVSAPPVFGSVDARPLAPVLPGNRVLMAPAPRPVAVAARVSAASKPVAVQNGAMTPEQLHIAAWQKRKHAKEQHQLWLQAKKANDWKWRLAQAQKRAVAAQNRRLWLAKQRQNHATYLASRKGKQRATLAARVGLAPKQMPANVPGQTVAPISPDELLHARDQFLQKNALQSVKQTSPVPTTGTPFVPSGLFVPDPLAANPMGDLKGNLNVLLFGTDQQKTRVVRDLSATRAEENQAGRGAPDSSGASTSSSMPVFAAPAVPAQTQTRVAVTNIVPLPSGAAPSRGGSPRDRAMMAWGSGVANQALSYRGMPYVFGSASPSRGFDCSGLIYFLLRQRGLNPPRTAAGYRSYGTAVSRGHWQTGDLILFANTYKRGISHIGVYLKDGKFVHAASTGKGVRVDSLSKGYFASKYWGARRVK